MKTLNDRDIARVNIWYSTYIDRFNPDQFDLELIEFLRDG